MSNHGVGNRETSEYVFPFIRPNEEPAKGWKSGDSFHYPIKEPKDKHTKDSKNPWEVLFDDLRKADESQCDAWKGEVDNLLVFAGLFSAVVTAFVIETYKTLSSDPNDTIINVLSIIASRLGDNSTILVPQPSMSDPFQTQFKPSKTFIRVNIYFFLSLVLSLSAALIGIVCLQWLRQHRTYPESLSAEQQFALLHMRTEAFRRWKVSAIFTTLPVLVQAALVLFFVGLVEFIWHIDHTVIIPVGSLIIAILLFLVLTTAIPTLQVFPLYNPFLQINMDVPVECPYRSPQAAVFRHVITSSAPVFKFCSALFTLAVLTPLLTHRGYCWLRDLIKPANKNVDNASVTAGEETSSDLLSQETALNKSLKLLKEVFWRPSNLIFDENFLRKTWAQESWNKFDINWMTVRDTYFRHGCGKASFLYKNRYENTKNPNSHMKHYYDAIHGLRKTIVDNFSLEDESLIFAAFHCAQALPIADLKNPDANNRFDPIPILITRNHYLSKILRLDKNCSITHLSDILQNPTRELLLDENACIFLDFVTSRDNIRIGGNPHTVSKTFAEVQFRLLGYLYGKSHPLVSDALSTRLEKPLVIQPRKIFFMPELDDENQPFMHQWSLALHSFFKNIVDEELKNTMSNTESEGSDQVSTFVAHPIFQYLLSYFFAEIRYNPSSSAISQSIDTLELIRNSLQKALKAERTDIKWTSRSHCLFYCASYYFYWIFRENPDFPALLKTLNLLHPVLKKYKELVPMAPPALFRTWIPEVGYHSLFSPPWWSFLDEWNLDSILKDNDSPPTQIAVAMNGTEKETTDDDKNLDSSEATSDIHDQQSPKLGHDGRVSPISNPNAASLV